jgi:phosphopantothenate-cysteine ligase
MQTDNLVDHLVVVLLHCSKKYKESQACRTEAEYAFQQRKKIVPVMMEKEYR